MGVDHIRVVATIMLIKYQRDKDVWPNLKWLREKISKIKNIKNLSVAPYGSTALASIRAMLMLN